MQAQPKTPSFGTVPVVSRLEEMVNTQFKEAIFLAVMREESKSCHHVLI